MDVLTRLGLSVTYKTIYRLLKNVNEEQRKQIYKFNKDFTIIITYDNYDYVIG